MHTPVTPPSGPGKTRVAPTRIAPETFLLHDHTGEGTAPVIVALNSLVIRSAEPVVVDTGVAANREHFLDDVFSLVEPEDIRWVFVTHDDIDHTGNVNALMEAAPNAVLVVNWFLQERMGATLEVSPLRQRWVGDGETLDVGDRNLIAVRPPIYDSPTTRGLFDPATGVYWASDAFATPTLHLAGDVSELDPGFWDEGMAMFNQYFSPWITLADDRRYQATVDRIEALDASVIAACHTPTIGRANVGRAIDVTRRSASATVAPQPDQAALDQIRRALAG